MQHANGDLWPPSSGDPITTPVRTRGFWLNALGDDGERPRGMARDSLCYATATTVQLGPLQIIVSQDQVEVRWQPRRFGPSQALAWRDDAHPCPILFRWKEAVAIAEHLEEKARGPSSPSLGLLLLSSFTAVTSSDDRADVERVFRDQLDLLGLLDADEIDRAVEDLVRHTVDRPSGNHSEFVPFDWKPNQRVGWQLEGGRATQVGGKVIMLGNHSTRRDSNRDFPASDFVDFLRSAGVDDV